MPAKLKVSVGDRFHRWVVIAESDNIGNLSASMCVCDCGVTRVVRNNSLVKGGSKSCGCLQRNMATSTHKKHGHSIGGQSATYRSWAKMLDRCNNKSNARYADYGGRGVKVCQRWHSFENFLNDVGIRPDNKSADRYPNNDGDYEPGNFRWATVSEQQRNRNVNVFVEYEGVKMLLIEAAEASGLSYEVLRTRIRRNWPTDRLFEGLNHAK